MLAFIGLCSFLTVFSFVMFLYHRQQEKRHRLKRILTGEYDQREEMNAKQKRETTLDKLQVLVNRAGLQWGKREIILLLSGTFAVGYIVGWLVFYQVFFGLVVGSVFLFIPYVHLRNKVRKRQFLLRHQFGDLLEYWVNSMTAGVSLPNAIRENLDNTSLPLQPIIQEVVNHLDARETLVKALKRVEPYMGFQEYRDIFIPAVELSQSVGRERFLEVLIDIANIIDEKERMQSNIFVYTAQGRYTANLTMFAPYLIFLYVRFQSVDYFAPLLEQAVGQMVLFVLLAMPLLGRYLISRMVSVRVE